MKVKNNQIRKDMKFIIRFFALMSAVLAWGCTPGEDPQTSSSEYPLLSFRLVSGGQTYHGSIDHSAGTVTFRGLVYGKSVTAADVRLAEGATISPDPQSFVGQWPASQTFTVTKDGKPTDYTVVLPDFQDAPYNDKVTLAYLRLYDMEKLKIISWKDITHIIPTFVYVRSDGTIDSGFMDPKIGQVKAMADANGVKTIIAFGGPGTGDYTQATNTEAKREQLAQLMWDYVEKVGADGLDIDYEDYTSIENDKTVQENVMEFFRVLAEIKPDPELIMTCTIAGAWCAYPPEWHTHFDYVSIMSYDYDVNLGTPHQHSPWNYFTRDIEYSLTTEQIPRSKLCPGVPFYGNTWDKELLQKIGYGSYDHHTISFSQIIDEYRDVPDITELNQYGQTLWNGKQLLREKCQYIMENDLAGIMIWSLDHDAPDYEDQLLPVVGEGLGINRQ